MRNETDRKSEVAIELAHPLAVAACEVVIDRDDVDPLALQRVQIDRRRRDEGLAFTRTHLCNPPLVETDAADHLHVKMPHTEHAARGLAHDGKRLWQDLLHRHALCELLAKFARVTREFVIREVHHRWLERVDLLNNATVAGNLLVIVVAKEAFENRRYSEQVVSHSYVCAVDL